MLTIRALNRFTGAVAAALCMTFTAAVAQEASPMAPAGAEAEQKKPADLLGFLEHDRVLGNEEADVRVIEYASLSCSHCMRSHTETFPQLKEHYIDTGKIAYIYRHFPLNEPALRGAMLAECAGDDGFFRYLKVLFNSQPQWAYDANFMDSLRSFAKVGGIGEEAFDRCMADKELEGRLVSGLKWAASGLNVQSTPTVFVNGQKLDGFQSFEKLSNLIDAELKDAAQ